MAQSTATVPESISLEHLLNEHVRDLEGRDIGKVEDLILDTTSGTIDFAIVKFGGFLGVGGTYHLIPWPMVSVDAENRTFTMNVTKEQVERAPSFDRTTVPRTDDRTYLDSVFQYWGIDRAQQHERMSQAQYGGQQASAGSQAQQVSSGQTYGQSEQQASGQQQTTGQPQTYGQQQTAGQPQSYGQQPSYAQQTGSTQQRSYDEQQAYSQQTGQTGSAQQRQTYGGAGESYGAGRMPSDVSYGNGQYGPERRAGDVHGWTGIERRAGW